MQVTQKQGETAHQLYEDLITTYAELRRLRGGLVNDEARDLAAKAMGQISLAQKILIRLAEASPMFTEE